MPSLAVVLGAFGLAMGALPPGPGPFSQVIMSQPVVGAPRGSTHDGWKTGKLCDVSKAPYSAVDKSNATAVLQQAINDCGNLPGGGTVLVPAPLMLFTASLWLQSNLTFRVEKNAALVGTATGSGKTPESINDAPLTYTRRGCTMMTAHAGFLNGGRCVKYKDPLVGWDDCAEWTKLSNVVIEGGGTLDANGDDWYLIYSKNHDGSTRPMMLDLLWVDGLTVRDMNVRRPGFWTVHPTFSNNVRVTGNSIITTGSNTDGCDPDSSWNVYIAHNTFSTGDDCIAIKAVSFYTCFPVLVVGKLKCSFRQYSALTLICHCFLHRARTGLAEWSTFPLRTYWRSATHSERGTESRSAPSRRVGSAT